MYGLIINYLWQTSVVARKLLTAMQPVLCQLLLIFIVDFPGLILISELRSTL